MKRITLITFLAVALVSGCADGVEYETTAELLPDSEASRSPKVATSEFFVVDVTVLSLMDLMPVVNAYAYVDGLDGYIAQSRTAYDGRAAFSVLGETEGWHIVMSAAGYRETHHFPASSSFADLDDTAVSMVEESTWEALYDSASVTADASAGLVLVRAFDENGAPLTSGSLRLYTDTEEIIIGEDGKSEERSSTKPALDHPDTAALDRDKPDVSRTLELDEHVIYNVPAGPNAATIRSGFRTGSTYFEVSAGTATIVDVRIR